MNILIHDLKPAQAARQFPQWTQEHGWLVFSDDGSIRSCIGCFGCWTRTPGACVLRDSYGDMGRCLARCEHLVLVSRCVYGGLSPFVKQVMDRSISYLHPDFTLRRDQMHHRRRYDNRLRLHVLFYGEDVTVEERGTANRLVRAMALNLDCDTGRVGYRPQVDGWKGGLL